jgi:hypothetical protein
MIFQLPEQKNKITYSANCDQQSQECVCIPLDELKDSKQSK